MKRLLATITFLFKFATLGLAFAFMIVLFKPELIPERPQVVSIHESRPTIPSGSAQPDSYASAVEAAIPAVVNIYTATIKQSPKSSRSLLNQLLFDELEPPKRSTKVETNLGSGLIMSEQGYVLTNYHVISNASEIEVMLNDGRSSRATVVGFDPETDLAVLRIKLKDLPVITLGDNRELRVGDVVLAIGNPLGVGQAVSMGIVSATGRKRLGLNTFENFIQTDAAINPGNSGGALINTHGELVGVNSAIFSRSGGSQGIGFAIPVNLARNVLEQILEHGRVIRGWLGVRMTNLTPGLAKSLRLETPYGVVVSGVYEDGPADKAGLQSGDVLVSVDGKQVYDARSMLDMIAQHKPGDTVRLEGIRKVQRFTAKVIVKERPPMTQR